MNTHQEFRELLDYVHVAGVLDERASTVKAWLENDPGRLPIPLTFEGSSLVRWPMEQIAAWIADGTPRDYPRPATDFVPWGIGSYAQGGELADYVVPNGIKYEETNGL